MYGKKLIYLLFIYILLLTEAIHLKKYIWAYALTFFTSGIIIISNQKIAKPNIKKIKIDVNER